MRLLKESTYDFNVDYTPDFEVDENGRKVFYKYSVDGDSVVVSPYRVNPNGYYGNPTRSYKGATRLHKGEEKEFLEYLISSNEKEIDELEEKKQVLDNEIAKLQRDIEKFNSIKSHY